MQKRCSVEGCERRYSCKGFCKIHYNADWAKRNPDKVAGYEKSRDPTTRRGTRLKSHAKWREANRERERVRSRDYYKANKEKISVAWSAYYEANKERLNANFRAYQKANPDKERARMHRRVAAELGGGGSYDVEEWLAKLNEFFFTCPGCGKTGCKLEADHIVPVTKGGSSYISNIQPLCRSCNAKKRTKIIRYLPWSGGPVTDSTA